MNTKNVEDKKRKVEDKEDVDIPFHETVRAYSADKELVLSAPGYARIITFSNKAASILKLCSDDDDDEPNAAISKVAKQIKRGISGLKNNNKENLHISHNNACAEHY
ncbi:hypothetical protein FQA39_LY13766 [Lamprigera yunnana]|nr:hypothetical protein FQA39_LY13766 [Lamprigera yunnana]